MPNKKQPSFPYQEDDNRASIANFLKEMEKEERQTETGLKIEYET